MEAQVTNGTIYNIGTTYNNAHRGSSPCGAGLALSETPSTVRPTIILVALLLVLGSVAIFLTNQNKGTTPGLTPTPVPSFLWQETSQVQGIDVMSGTAKVSLRKDISTTVWMLTAPEQYPAETFQVDNVASTLQRLEATKVATGTTDLAQYGLDKPGMTVTVTFSSTTPLTHTFMVGSGNFDGTGFYIKQPDSPDVYLSATTPIGTIQNWLATPPKQAPTPTPFPTAPANSYLHSYG